MRRTSRISGFLRSHQWWRAECRKAFYRYLEGSWLIYLLVLMPDQRMNIMVEGGYSAFTNLFSSVFMTLGSVVYSMSSMGSLCGSKGPCARM